MCLSNKATLFQTKGGISDGALRVTYYDSRGVVSCNLIFHVADPIIMSSYYPMCGVSVFGGLRFGGSRIRGSRDTHRDPYFKHLGTKLNCTYTKDKL